MVVFEREDGTLYWVIGHIEYITLAKADVNLKKISDADLQRIDKDPTLRVSIDDPRAIFIFRFCVEVDKDGNDLTGYQHQDCHAYRLTYDNNGDAWRFTSNYQVISVVQLERHTVLPG